MTAKKLDQIRGQITALVDQRADIADAPMARDEVGAHLDAVLGAVESHPILGPSPAGLYDGSFGTTELEKLLRKPGVLIALLREPLKAYLLQVFDAEAGDATGLPLAQRRKKLSALDGEIYELERSEEIHIESLEAAGTDVLRRPDADPRAALGLGLRGEAA